jgi:protein-S-isoprenylcysteine O-methyltransferase Ste14
MAAERADRGLEAVRMVIRLGLFVGLLFGAAGRLDWARGWGFLAFYVVSGVAHVLVMRRHDPELMARRQRLGEGTKRWDKVLLGFIVTAPALVGLVGGLDVRFGWSSMPPLLFAAGAAGALAGFVAMTWAMMCNTHFEGTVRIQRDRDHRVVDGGPYRLVRHPGYVAALLVYVCLPLMVGSWWAYLPAGVSFVAMVVRTGLEDRTLRRELQGYVAYAGRVRYRLVPGVW